MSKMYWIAGSAIYCHSALKHVFDQHKDATIRYFDEDSSTDELEGFLFQSSIFNNENKIAVIKQVPSLPKLKKYLEKDPPSNIVFYKLSREKYDLVYKAVEKKGEILYHENNLDKSQAMHFVCGELEEKKKKFKPSDIEYALDAAFYSKDTGYSFDALYLWTKQLLYYLGSTKELEFSDILSLITPIENNVVWELFDLLDAKDFNKAYMLYNKLASEEDPSYLERFLYLLYNRYKLLLYCKESLAAKKHKADIKSDIKNNLIKLKAEGNGTDIRFVPVLDKENNPQKMYHEYSVNLVLNPPYGKPDPLAGYSRKELMTIYSFIQSVLEKFREYSATTKKSVIDMLLLLITKKIEPERLHLWKNILH